MEKEKHDSDSKTQSKKEVEIIDNVINKLLPQLNIKVTPSQKDSFLISQNDKVKMQFDLYLPEEKVIGEVYVTELPLNSGRRRKIMSDLLKIITFERLKQNEGQGEYKKFYFLTITEEQERELTRPEKINNFIKHSRENSFIGKDAWINVTLKEFGIQLYYFVIMDKKFLADLKLTRAKQTEGMKG